MRMSLQSKGTILLFDRFSLAIPSKLKCHEDGEAGKRVLFITDMDETFIITFEEGMRMMDMNPNYSDSSPTVSFQCCKDGKYIHQRRAEPKQIHGFRGCAFFHIEMDDVGTTVYLPGQMTVKAGYQWSDGVEPVLLDIMNGIAVCKTKDDGGS